MLNCSNSKKSENSSSRPETASTRVSDSDKMPELIQGLNLQEFTFGMDVESLLAYDQMLHKEDADGDKNLVVEEDHAENVDVIR